MFSVPRKINDLLNRKERAQAFFLMGMMITMSFAEVLGIASILPFMSVLSNPGTVTTNPWLRQGYEFFGFESTNRYLFFLGLIVLAMLVLSNGIKALTQWQIYRFSHMRGYSLSRRLFGHYLNQPYSFFLTRNSGDLSKNILAEIQILTANVILPFMEMIARVLICLFILVLLFITDPLLAFITILTLGGAFVIVYAIFHRRFFTLGQDRYNAQSQRYKLVNEGLQGIKNIKLTGHEETYQALYDKPCLTFAKTQADNNIIRELPRYVLEIIAFGGILVIVLYLLIVMKSLEKAMPLIALYAFAGYRLMPNLQAIYTSITKMRFHAPVLDSLWQEMRDHKVTAPPAGHSDENIAPLPFQDSIKIDSLSFRYETAQENILSDIDIEMKANTTIGIIGKTGSGKTTLVDLLLGLLTTQDGQILIDGTALTTQNIRAWQKNLAYVSQHIYLSDDTLRRNIAFGLSNDDIDDDMVRKAAEMAALSDFIERDLPQGYDTVIGENGVRLSGGQRQRVGLARAFYLNRPVIVLDEATSALDTETEDNVMDAINAQAHNKTIIMIAHRLSTISQCDQVITLDKGRIDKTETKRHK